MDFVLLAAGNWFYELWNGLWLLICEAIYIFIGLLYQVFEKIASVNLFNAEIFEKITGRLYLIIGIAMLFIFAYNIILAIINPDGKDKGTAGLAKSVKETIISLVIVVLLPTIFNYMYVLQTNILESNIIGTIVLGGAGSTSGDSSQCEPGDYDCTCDFSTFNLDEYNNDIGWKFWKSTHTDMTSVMKSNCEAYKKLPASQRGAYSIGPTVFSTFYRPANFTFEQCASYLSGGASANISSDEDKKICVNYFTDVVLSKYTGNIGPFVKDSYLKDIISDTSKDSMEFHWIMAVVAGVLAVYMFFCYAMEVGVRVAKLGFLQLISPIPVMLRIVPGQKEKVFDKWFTHLKNAYIDVFIRLAIIYFALFGIGLVPDVINTMWDSVWDGQSVSTNLITNFFVKSLVTAFVILGLLKFAQEAPGLFKEFFGGSGNFALKSPRRQLQENKLAMGGIGLAAGGMQNMLGNYYKATHNEKGQRISGSFKRGALSAAGGFFGGAARGAIHGARTNDLRNLGGELRQAKYETDEARARREANLLYAKEKKYRGPFKAFRGGLAQTKESLDRYIKTDGSGKVTANAAQMISKKFKDIDDKYTSAELKRIKNSLEDDANTLKKPIEGQNFNIGKKSYTFSDGAWKHNGVAVDYEVIIEENKNDVHSRELREKASIYKKRHGELCVDVENALDSFVNNSSNLPYEKLSGIISDLNNIKVSEGGKEYKLSDVKNVENLRTSMLDLSKSDNVGDLMLLAELNDIINKKVGSLSGEIAGRTETNETKK